MLPMPPVPPSPGSPSPMGGRPPVQSPVGDARSQLVRILSELKAAAEAEGLIWDDLIAEVGGGRATAPKPPRSPVPPI